MSSVVPLRSSSCQSPDLVLPRPFPSVLTTRAFDQSRRRWFGTCSCQPVPRGQPSSIKQLHTLGPPRPFALVAHYHPHIGRQRRRRERTSCATRPPRGRIRNADRYWQATAKSPTSITPASSHFWISRSIRQSATRCWRNFNSQPRSRLSKECTTQSPP